MRGWRQWAVLFGASVMLALAGCQGGGSAAPTTSPPQGHRAAGNDGADLASHQPEPGASGFAAERSGGPGSQTPDPGGGTASGKPPGKAPVATMPATRYVQTGGVAGYRELSVDRYGRWTRRSGGSGRLTQPQIRELNRLLTSDALAAEARRYAESSNPDKGCFSQPHLTQQLHTDRVSLRKTSCDRNEVPTPTYDRIVQLLTSYTGG